MILRKKSVEETKRRAEELKKEEMRRALKVSKVQLPEREKFVPYTAEYRTFLEELKQEPKTLYEKACSFAEKIFPIEPDSKSAANINESLKAGYVNATPKGTFSLTAITSLVALVAAIIFIVMGGGIVFGVFGLVMVFVLFWTLYNYPHNKAKSIGIQMSANTVLAVLYMIIYMRSSPNLEGAIKFAARNLEGPLSWDLRKLIWDIETGKYASADYALIDYINKWKTKNKEFAEALNMLRGSAVESSRREKIYEETVDVILNGTRERARHYAAGLRMPMTLIYALGVLLPVMGLILFPVVLIFISDYVKPHFLFFGYNILLPISLLFIVNSILANKPPTFSPPDLSKAKGVPPLGKFNIAGKNISILPLSIAMGIPFVLIGILGMANPDTFSSVNFSMIAIFGISVLIVSYAFLDSYQKIKIRNDIEKIEDEFAVALFQFGNIISEGVPIESAIDKVRNNLKGTKIMNLFEIVSLNMKKFGCTFERALFDNEIGAVWFYPSKLIHSIMQTIIESSKKSVKSAAESMIVISTYLKDVHNVKEEIEEILGETTSSMRFLAMFLSPMVSGVTVTLAVIIIQILTKLGEAMKSVSAMSDAGAIQAIAFAPWIAGGGTPPISPAMFQVTVGIYMVETAVLLSIFLNGIKYGEDPVGLRNTMWSILFIGLVIYIISWLVTYSIFGEQISALLMPG